MACRRHRRQSHPCDLFKVVGLRHGTVAVPPARGRSLLDGTIAALGLYGGGMLTLQAIAMQIGASPAATPFYAFYLTRPFGEISASAPSP